MKSLFGYTTAIIAALAFVLNFALPSNLRAAELIMIEQENCPWCEAFHEEIGGIYHKTKEGKRAPLRFIDIHDELPKDLKSMTLGIFTPTFVLWANGKEISRIRGYPGDEFFWFMLGEMLDKLPDSGKKPTG